MSERPLPTEAPKRKAPAQCYCNFFGSKEGHYEPGSGYECVLSVYG